MIRTGPNTRAAVLLSDGTQLKLAPNSTIQIKQVSPRRPGKVTPVAAGGVRTVLQFFLGESWLRSTGPAEELEIETPSATAATKGTEFALAVAPDGASTLAVVDGLVLYANPRGAVLVAGGEEATAQVGQAPTKRVLLNPLDAVQWSLYYPGTLSLRDYPGLSQGELAELEAILALVQNRGADAEVEAEARLTVITSLEEDPSNSAAHFLFNQLIFAEGRTGFLSQTQSLGDLVSIKRAEP